MSRRLVSSDEAKPRAKQHKTPCSDCPWSRTSLPGWLGGSSIEEWLARAHGEVCVPCHTVGNQQCAGLAIYRANVLKRPRDPNALLLPKDTQRVFAWPTEFTLHHKGLSPTGRKLRNEPNMQTIAPTTDEAKRIIDAFVRKQKD
jgi:hypothetical protein